jgi:hypothetical protein
MLLPHSGIAGVLRITSHLSGGGGIFIDTAARCLTFFDVVGLAVGYE